MISEIFVTKKMDCNSASVTEVINDIKSFAFSGGEVHVELPPIKCKHLISDLTIVTRIQCGYDLIELLMATDALKRLIPKNTPISVIVPYLPYARQDKISVHGESLSLRVFADLINSQGYAKIVTYDVHSDVSLALIDNLKSISQESILNYLTTDKSWSDSLKHKTLVCPDAGAAKKLPGLIKALQPVRVVHASKVRDGDGNIVSTEVHCADLINESVVIVDDIIDGGRTFIELAKALKDKGCGSITLFATHGIFSKGVKVLYEGGIDKILTTDTFEFDDSFGFGDEAIAAPIVGKLVGRLL